MSDIKDILGLQRAGPSDSLDVKKERPAKEPKAQRPAGMSREAFALLGDSHPIAPSELANELKKPGDAQGLAEKRKQKGPVTWQNRSFTNQARSDGLQLRHWVKCAKDAHGRVREVQEGDYQYAKCNKQTMVYKYDEEEWANLVPHDPAWSRAETDYLLDCCAVYQLRFLVIADRYHYAGGPPRGLEELKARYFGVARALMVGRAGGEDLIANEALVKHPFNAAHELRRKAALEALLARGREEEVAEDAVLEQAKAIESRRKAEASARRAPPAAPPLDFVATSEFADDAGAGVPSLFDADVAPSRPPPGVYARGKHTEDVAKLQLSRLAGPPRHQTAVEELLTKAGLAAPPRMPTRAICGAWLAARAEAIRSSEHRRAGSVAPGAGAAPAAAPADSAAVAGTPAQPGAPPAAAGLADVAMPAALPAATAGSAATPEGETPVRTKRSHKGKAPQRYEDSMSGSAPRTEKRPRTAKKFADETATLHKTRRGIRPHPATGPADPALAQPEEDESPVAPCFVTALLLAWAASRGRSLFAARCLVATALELYARGATVDDVQLALSFAGLQSSGARLAEDERNVLTSWAALVFLTAEEVGCPAGGRRGKPSERADAGGGGRGGGRGGSAADTGSSGSGSSSNAGNSASTSGTGSGTSGGAGAEAAGAADGGSSAMSLGMRRFVKQAVAQFAGGTRLTDLIELQASGGSGAAVPPSVRLMQQNTRLIILTLELLEDCGTALQLPEPPPPAQQQPHAIADSGSGSALRPQPGSPSSAGSSSAQASQLQREEQPPAQLDQQRQQQRQQEQLGAQGCSPAAASDSRQRRSTTAAGQPAVTGSPAAASPAPPASESQSAAAGQFAAQADTYSTLGGGCSDPVGYVAAFPATGGPLPGARPASARLLISYMGAMLGARASAAAFVEEAARCYRRGLTARQLYTELSQADFEQQGGMLAVALPSSPAMPSVTAEIFSRWLSSVYMTLAQLGVPRPGRDAADGWAWAGGGSGAAEAHAIADFVTNTLRSSPPGLPGSATLLDSPALEQMRAQAMTSDENAVPPGARQRQRGPADFSTVRMEDPSLAATSSSVVALGQQIDLINFAAAHADALGLVPASAGRQRLAWAPPSEQQAAERERRWQEAGNREADIDDDEGGTPGGRDMAARQLARRESRQQEAGSRTGAAGERQRIPCPWPRRVNRRVV